MGGTRLESEIGCGLPIGRRFAGTSRVELRTSEHSGDYRIGGSTQALEQDRLRLQFGRDAELRMIRMVGLQEGAGPAARTHVRRRAAGG